MSLIRTAALGLASAVLAAGAAFAFPDKPVNYVIPFNPGGESDISARLQQPYFAKFTGQDLVIQYQPGAGGAQAWAALNGMPGDGYTIMGTNLPHIVMQPLLQDPGYKTEDLINIYMFHYTPDALIVRADSPHKTLDDVIAAAKAAPGAVTVAGSGTNSANHLANQLFENATGAKMTYIPYSGTAPSVTALLGGETEVAWGYTTVGAQQGEAVRMLAVAMEERHPLFPDVPTFKELGVAMVGGAYRGIAVPKSTPEDVRQRLSDIIGQINADPDFVKQMLDGGFAMLDVPYAEMDAWLGALAEEYRAAAAQLAANK